MTVARVLSHPRPTVHSIWPCGSSVGRKTSLLLSSPNAERFIRMKCMFGQAMLISEISGTAASAASPIRYRLSYALAGSVRKHFQHRVEDLVVGRRIARRLARPFPGSDHCCRAHPVAGRRDRRIGIPNVVLPTRLRRLHEGEAVDAGRHGRGTAADLRDFHHRLAVAVEHETVWMRLAAETEPAPFGLVRGDRNRRYLRICVE